MITVWRENIAPLLSEWGNRAVRKRPEKMQLLTSIFPLSGKRGFLPTVGDYVAC